MLMFTKNQDGLTIIEILMSLAITGLLMSAILFGRDNLRAQVAFSKSVDEMVNIILVAKSSRNFGDPATTYQGAIKLQGELFGSAVAINDQPGGGANGEIIGNLIDDPTTGNFLCTPCSYDYRKIDSTTHATSNVIIVFGIDKTGQHTVYFYNSPPGDFSGFPANANSANIQPITAPFAIQLADNSGHHATITIDASGNVTRVIQ